MGQVAQDTKDIHVVHLTPDRMRDREEQKLDGVSM